MKTRQLCVLLSGLLLGAAACGGETRPEDRIAGTWVVESIQVLGTNTPCPGELHLTADVSFSCNMHTLTFDADGAFTLIDVTDEDGVPYDRRTEGTWSLDEDLMNLRLVMQGTSEGDMQLMEPPILWIMMWTVTDDTLTLGIISDYITVTTTYRRG